MITILTKLVQIELDSLIVWKDNKRDELQENDPMIWESKFAVGLSKYLKKQHVGNCGFFWRHSK